MTFLERARGLTKSGPLAPFLGPAADDPQGEPENDVEMTLVEHLDELRGRLIKSVLAIGVGTAGAFVLTPQLFVFLLGPAPESIKRDGLVFLKPAEAFLTYFQVALMAGIGIALPIVFWQILAFVLPALTRRERRLLFSFTPLVLLFFVLGVLFGYYVTLRFALDFLIGFTAGGFFRPMITAEAYLEFVSMLLFWMGLSFQTPIVILFLAKVGLVNPKRLASYRKYAILAAFVIAAVITPTPDPLNQALVAIPLWILYEVGILLSRFT
jgi:sec-independent protein translocase protein TatC